MPGPVMVKRVQPDSHKRRCLVRDNIESVENAAELAWMPEVNACRDEPGCLLNRSFTWRNTCVCVRVHMWRTRMLKHTHAHTPTRTCARTHMHTHMHLHNGEGATRGNTSSKVHKDFH